MKIKKCCNKEPEQLTQDKLVVLFCENCGRIERSIDKEEVVKRWSRSINDDKILGKIYLEEELLLVLVALFVITTIYYYNR